jgi:hypothetical protein
MFLFVLIVVALASFGLGRLSVGDIRSLKASSGDISITGGETQVHANNAPGDSIFKDTKEVTKITTTLPEVPNSKKMYVASKNGKLYYTVSCSGAKRIADKNKVWFESASEAEKSGYKRASSCK